MKLTRFITSTALAVVLLAVLIPTAAMAKAKVKSKAVTKSEVISLIKQYSKPGKTGATGPAGATGVTGATGTPGAPGANASLTLAPNSGLMIGSGNGLSLLPSLTQPCAYHQSLYYLDPIGNGTAWCSFPTQGQFAQGGFASGAPSPDPQTALTSTLSNVAEETVNYASGTNKYLVTGVVEFESLQSETAGCELIDETSNTVLEIEDDSVDGYANLSFLDVPSIPSGDALGIKCSTGTSGSVYAEATLSAIPLG